MIIRFLLYVILLPVTWIPFFQAKVYVCSQNTEHVRVIASLLHECNVAYEVTTTIDLPDNQNLYILDGLFLLSNRNLPRYYIAYQSLNLNKKSFTDDYLGKLSNALAVWDTDKNNIAAYRNRLYNYLFLPQNYEHSDPVILPCKLPADALQSYKELLCYSNQKNTDISSHLPAIFCHALLQNPHIIVEAGVRGGESTKPLYKAAQFCKSQLIGVDIEPLWAKSTYNAMDNAFCLEMSDVDFASYYVNSPYKDTPVDLVFIDTSHEYRHTLQEITVFVSLLSDDGALMFHDSNVTPLTGGGYVRLNGSLDAAPGNPRGVPQAIKEYFALDFDEYHYCNKTFEHNGITWHMIHYPFCNGFTVIKKLAK